MLFVSIAFAVLLLVAHAGGDMELALATPLSLFRDGRDATLGYWMFGLLLAAGAILMQLLVRLRWWLDAAVLLISFMMLFVVAATPSVDTFHNVVALLLLLLVYLYYAFLFYRLESRWFWGHLVVPAVIVLTTRLHSYGLWQKSLIVYYVFAMNLQYYAFAAWLKTAAKKRPTWTLPKRDTERRQKVYSLEE